MFIKIYEKKVKPHTAAKLTTWLYRVTVNACLDLIRRTKRISFRSLEVGESGEKGSPSPGQEAALQELQQAVTREVHRLPEKYRVPILLYQFEELPYSEIAEVLGVTEKAVERRLYHAKRLLRNKLSGFV